ncbi:unnamed protein product [Ceratitis capitata]|uniref:(Mediterranean fruit fly) hypothetical protein n=1 Tax=Ceratitis capitata TaxID=7213 RepID=A0A811V644_CERCA|nr:unnamed protein product [Ceratitis capitata]
MNATYLNYHKKENLIQLGANATTAPKTAVPAASAAATFVISSVQNEVTNLLRPLAADLPADRLFDLNANTNIGSEADEPDAQTLAYICMFVPYIHTYECLKI